MQTCKRPAPVLVSTQQRSPLTNEAMGIKLLTALQVKNMIRGMVKIGALTGRRWAATQPADQRGDGHQAAVRAPSEEHDPWHGKDWRADWEKVDTWKEKLAEEEMVAEMRHKAEAGDGVAMCNLGRWYLNGMKGLTMDHATAFKWFFKSHEAGMCGWHRGARPVGEPGIPSV